jgi:hypothetical protein
MVLDNHVILSSLTSFVHFSLEATSLFDIVADQNKTRLLACSQIPCKKSAACRPAKAGADKDKGETMGRNNDDEITINDNINYY